MLLNLTIAVTWHVFNCIIRVNSLPSWLIKLSKLFHTIVSCQSSFVKSFCVSVTVRIHHFVKSFCLTNGTIFYSFVGKQMFEWFWQSRMFVNKAEDHLAGEYKQSYVCLSICIRAYLSVCFSPASFSFSFGLFKKIQFYKKEIWKLIHLISGAGI